MRVTVDGDRCCGFGACVEMMPALFRLRDEDGLAEAVRETADDDQSGLVSDVAKACPTEAIKVDG